MRHAGSSPSPRGRGRDPAGEARQADRLAGEREEGQQACLFVAHFALVESVAEYTLGQRLQFERSNVS
jgi:hypothetical protein